MPTTVWTLENGGAAEDAADVAKKWAQNPEDVPVETDPDQFSALHWAAKSAESATEAAAAADRIDLGTFDADVAATAQAKLDAQAAQAAAEAAQAAAEAAQAGAAFSSWRAA